jgi:nucleotide-binding universal stress UspA family protein
MQDIRHIIVPVDFHRHTDDLADFATGIAKKLDAKITFVHVVGNAEYHADMSPAAGKVVTEELCRYAEKKMSQLLEANKSACPGCSGTVMTGEAADSIVEFARENEADLIIMGTHGAQGIEKILLGSVAERVLKRAHCPTLIFNPYKGDRGYQISPSISESVQPV